MSISFESRGSFKNTERFLKKMKEEEIFKALDRYGAEGVAALASATPKDSGLTAGSWNYEVTNTKGGWTISWTNNVFAGSAPLVIMLQYGHGTGTGGYVVGRDYINPAMRPIFDKIANDVWKAVTSA